MQEAPRSPVKIRFPSFHIQRPVAAKIEDGRCSPGRPFGNIEAKSQILGRPQLGDRQQSIRKVSADVDHNEVSIFTRNTQSGDQMDTKTSSPGVIQQHAEQIMFNDLSLPNPPFSSPLVPSRSGTPEIRIENLTLEQAQPEIQHQLQYHHNPTQSQSTIGTFRTTSSGQTFSSSSSNTSMPEARLGRKPLPRPESAFVLGTDSDGRGRSLTPSNLRNEHSLSPSPYRRNLSAGPSSDARPMSYIDLLNTPYSQQVAQQNITFDNAKLRGAVGSNAALLDSRKTLEQYRHNVKKMNDPAMQYEFAIFMVNAAQETAIWSPEERSDSPKIGTDGDRSRNPREELLREARQILQKLADRSYPFAQYYLGDGFASGVFNKGKEDYGNAFPLFVSAGKHGHAEAGYRAALCYEFGWGCRKDYAKAVQFYRQSASKNHPGAATRLGKACLTGEMGLFNKNREGIKWLKRASESADAQHNSAPYELGLLHISGYGDDVFKDEGYAAQLFTQAAELGHAEANLTMGEAYEHGLLTCPRDPALSIHFYNGAAQGGLPKAMMALCAWYMIGAEPVLPKDEAEAYEWAKRAADTGKSRLSGCSKIL